MKASETLRAPAKLNLTLEVLQRRDDGLHGIRSVMVPIALHDEIAVEPAESFAFRCDAPNLQDANIVVKAVEALEAIQKHFSLTLYKRIPTGAGLGGGSSDAAAVLLAASRGVFGPVVGLDFVRVARSLGSDVPFFLSQTAALVEGTGERVTALGAVPPWHAVIVRPPVEVSTAWAYREIDAVARESRPRNASASLQMCEALQRADFSRALSVMQNDFEEPIARATSEIGTALGMLRHAGARKAMLTGSGSCVFAIFADERDALTCHGKVSNLSEVTKGGYALYRSHLISGDAWRSAA